MPLPGGPWLEWFAVATALIYVYLATKGSYYCFIFGLISSAIFVWICYKSKLYFDMSINIYYVVISVVGWVKWKSAEVNFTVKRMAAGKLMVLTLLSAILTLLFGYIFTKYSDASLPYIDAFTTVFAVLATWMLVQKFLENWLLWIIVDAVSIGMYYYKEHLPISLLFLIYTLISVYGYFNWRKKKQMT